MHPKTRELKVKLLKALFQHRDRDKAVTPQVLESLFGVIEHEFNIVYEHIDALETKINQGDTGVSLPKSKANRIRR